MVLLSLMIDLAEKVELKNLFNKRFGRYKVKEIQSSRLWTCVTKGGKKGKVDALLVSASNLKHAQRQGM